jgi:hypothetical protein
LGDFFNSTFDAVRIITAVQMIQFVSGRMSYKILIGSWCNVNVLNVHASTEDETYDGKGTFYEELDRVFRTLPKYHTKILLGNVNAKVGWEDIFTLTIGNQSLQEISNDNGFRLVNFATSKNLSVRSTMFSYRNIHEYTSTSLDRNFHNQIDYILVDNRMHSNVLDVRSSGQQIVILTTIWWWQKSGRD